MIQIKKTKKQTNKHLRIPPGRFPESFVKMGLDLAEIKNRDFLFVCLFFVFYLSYLVIPPGRFAESSVEIRFDLSEILLF